ncbi:MAG TPA: low-specificity L-threonine aldolase [Lacibacter sp.]|nr:low-specificity L-threonine aldolase [Lacibacter sp.]HMO89828.1 low-specificity L-threonine aldolase [Lacibacter sp.]HMP86520.1 low-specificity L-threonine aldolase [Lacibacter sp.]
MEIIDFRSDTVTRPTPGMRQAMAEAQVGDDVFGEDPGINELEQKAADLFGMEAGLFCPSGTMTNQVAIKVHTQPGDEVICDELSHVYQYEGGGIAFNAGASVRLLHGDRGRITARQVEASINPDDVHKAHSRLVVLENTSNRGGGSCYQLAEIEAIQAVCRDHRLGLHLDGARLFNALVATGQRAPDYGRLFDSISICLSKGLGCPVGSVLVGANDFIRKARRVRKVLGGGMRQAGFLAAAGIYALDHHIERLAEDHQHARWLEEAVRSNPLVETVLPVETNILLFNLKEGMPAKAFTEKLRQKGILAYAMGPQQIRLVVHLDISSAMVNRAAEQLVSLR